MAAQSAAVPPATSAHSAPRDLTGLLNNTGCLFPGNGEEEGSEDDMEDAFLATGERRAIAIY